MASSGCASQELGCLFTPKSSAYLFVPASSLPSLDSYPTKEDALKIRASLVESFQGRPRLIFENLIDIGNEPDDQSVLNAFH